MDRIMYERITIITINKHHCSWCGKIYSCIEDDCRTSGCLEGASRLCRTCFERKSSRDTNTYTIVCSNSPTSTIYMVRTNA